MSSLNETSHPSEIDFKLIGRFIKSYVRFVFKNWIALLIAALLGIGLALFVTWFYGVKYTSTVTYSIQNNMNNSALSSALSLASSFGLGTKSGSSFDPYYFAELSRSKQIIKETLMQEATVNDKADVLANHFYYCSKFVRKWNDENSPLYQFSFKHNTIQNLTRLEDSVLSVYYSYILDKYLTIATAENNAFNRITFLSPNRDFCRVFLKEEIKLIQKHYKKSIENINNFNYDIASKRVDSLADAMRIADIKVAQLKDRSLNDVKQVGLIELNNAIREQSLLNIQYSAAVNNYEASKTSLLATAPVIQIIDHPDFTLETDYINPITAIIVGVILSLVLTLGTLFLMRLFST